MTPEPRPLLVITPPPTPNGRLHIGHVGGPFLRADMLVRLNRYVAGRESMHMSHVDVYQSYVPKRAAELGRDVMELRDDMSSGIEADFKAYGIDHDLMVDNTSPEYLAFLDRVLEHALPRLALSSTPVLQCAECSTLLHEAYIKGHCGTCLHHTYANVCENCTLPQSLDSIIDPYCGRCGARSFVETQHDQVSIDISEADLQSAKTEVGPLCLGNRRLRAMYDSLTPHSVALSYPVDYGVFPSPLDGALNPWLEIFFAHLYGALRLRGIDTSAPFTAVLAQMKSPERHPEVVYFFGVDNSYWYAFLFPYFALKLGIDALWPSALNANFFMQLNGAKVSSSRNNVRWAADLADEAPMRELRTQLAASCPEFAPSDFVPRGGVRTDDTGDRAVSTVAELRAAPVAGQVAQALLARLDLMADPGTFSLEGLVNALEEGVRHEARLREGGQSEEAEHVRSIVHGVCEALDLA